MNRTLEYVAVEILFDKHRYFSRLSGWEQGAVPFLYIWPIARVISKSIAVPLVGSIAPKLQASLQSKTESMREQEQQTTVNQLNVSLIRSDKLIVELTFRILFRDEDLTDDYQRRRNDL